MSIIEVPFLAGRILGGRWTIVYADPSRNRAGAIVGRVESDGSATVFLDPPSPVDCGVAGLPAVTHAEGFILHLTVTDTSMEGDSTFVTCAASITGRAVIVRG
jgi:hypothetical protein